MANARFKSEYSERYFDSDDEYFEQEDFQSSKNSGHTRNRREQNTRKNKDRFRNRDKQYEDKWR